MTALISVVLIALGALLPAQQYQGPDGAGSARLSESRTVGNVSIREFMVGHAGSGYRATFLVQQGDRGFFLDGNDETYLFAIQKGGSVVALVTADPTGNRSTLADPVVHRLQRFDLRPGGLVTGSTARTRRAITVVRGNGAQPEIVREEIMRAFAFPKDAVRSVFVPD